MRVWLITSMALTLAASSAAEIYRWTDSNGQLHFSQSLDKVPSAYRSQAKQRTSSNSGSLQTFDSSRSSASLEGISRVIKIPFRKEHSLMRVDATINGRLDIPFYIDTGASGVSIPAIYAERLGIRIGPDTPRVDVRTANGILSTPLVRLDSVKLGAARVDGLMATVNPTMNVGLLGGSFFNNFNYSVDPSSNVITMTPNLGVASGLGEDQWRRRFSEIRQPLAELEQYLEGRTISRKGRREELEKKREMLQSKLRALEVEANRDDVPASWRR